MSFSRLKLWTLSLVLMFAVVDIVYSQDYPNKPIRILTSEAGAGSDFTARLIAQMLTPSMGQQVIVDNRSAFIAIETAAKSLPDGYTLLVAGPPLWIGPLMKDLSFDAARDFAPISLVNSAPSVVVVHPSLPVNSVKDLIALAKARPGALNYASTPTGSSPHLAAELFKSMTRTNIVQITYKGTGSAITELLGGQVQLMFSTLSPALPHVKSGRLKALAVTSAEPSALLPGLPTVAAAGLPGYEAVTMLGVFAPAKSPLTLVNRLNQEIVRALNMPDVKAKFLSVGLEVVGSSPAQLTAMMKSEMARMGKVIKDAGIHVD